MPREKIEFYHDIGRLVFYNNLQQYNPNMYERVIRFKNETNYGSANRLERIGNNFMNYASIEARKEIKMLSLFFGQKITLGEKDTLNSEIGRQIIEAVNTTLQFKSMFDRAYTRIVGKEGSKSQGHAKITGAQFFAEYFARALELVTRENVRKIKKTLDPNSDMQLIAKTIIPDEAVSEALEKSLFDLLKKSGDWSKNDENKGYLEFFDELEKEPNLKQFFLDQVYDAYHLDNFKDNLRKEIAKGDFFEKKASQRQSLMRKALHERKDMTMKGTFAEVMGTTAQILAVKKGFSGSAGNVNFHAEKSGQTLGKSDITSVFGIDYSEILDVINGKYANRAERVEAYKELHRKLKNVKDGFIIYTNAKDYSLVRNEMKNGYTFGKSGFKAGSPVKLDTMEDVLEGTPGSTKQLIQGAMNTMEGAVFSGLKHEIEQEFMQKMAYFLFDDNLTIATSGKGAQGIHLLLLDGVYIPLSYLFFLIGESILRVHDNMDDYFVVNINSGEIKYEHGGTDASGNFTPGQWRIEDWIDQKNRAYEEITIEAHFLRNFVDVIRSLRK